MPEPTIEESLYFPTWMSAELVDLAARLGVSVGTLVWASWEAAKTQLYQMTALLDDIPPEGSIPPVARVRPAPPIKAPPTLTLPHIAPQNAWAARRMTLSPDSLTPAPRWEARGSPVACRFRSCRRCSGPRTTATW